MAAFNWSGQFNIDFTSFLLLAGIWIAWRHNFSPAGLGLSLLMVLGIMFFAPYLLMVSLQAKGDLKKILMGDKAA